MTELSIYLTDGFAKDRVVVRMNGEQVYARDNVTTQLLIGLADSFEVEAHSSRLVIEIDVPSRDLGHTIEIDVAQGTHVVIWIESGNVMHFISATPVGFP